MACLPQDDMMREVSTLKVHPTNEGAIVKELPIYDKDIDWKIFIEFNHLNSIDVHENYILNLTQRNEDIVGVSFGGFKAKTSNIESFIINILPKLQFMEVY